MRRGQRVRCGALCRKHQAPRRSRLSDLRRQISYVATLKEPLICLPVFYYRVGRRRLYSPLRIGCELVVVMGQNGHFDKNFHFDCPSNAATSALMARLFGSSRISCCPAFRLRPSGAFSLEIIVTHANQLCGFSSNNFLD